MSVPRNTDLPQHSCGSGAHYGSLPLLALPDGDTTGDIFYYSGSQWRVVPLSTVAGSGSSSGMTNPMTDVGDMIFGQSGGSPTNLPIGLSGEILTVVSGVPTWRDAPDAARAYTVIVAASDTPAALSAGADYVCDGTADQVEINQAITDTGNDSGPPGSVLLLPGTYYITAAIDFEPWDTTAVTDNRFVFEATAATIHAAANLTQMVKVNGVSVAAGYFLNRFDIRIGSLHGESGTYTVSRAFEIKRASDNHIWIGNITFVSGDGFYCDQSGVSDTGTFNNFIEINRIASVDGIAFRIIGGDNIHGFEGNIIKTGQIWGCGTGFSMGQAANKNARYNTIISSPIEHNDYGIIDRGGANTWIINNLNNNAIYGVTVASGITRRSTFQFTTDIETIDPTVYAEHYVLEWGKFAGRTQFKEKSATPSTPESGYGEFYFRTDGKPYALNDAGTEYDLTGGPTVAGGSSDGHAHVIGEEILGDGATTTFTLINEPATNEIAAYISGLRTNATLSFDQITFAVAPASGTHYIDYVPAEAYE